MVPAHKVVQSNREAEAERTQVLSETEVNFSF